MTAALAMLAVMSGGRTWADEATLQSGVTIRGVSFPVQGIGISPNQRTARLGASGPLPEPFWLIDDGVRRYIVPARLTNVEKAAAVSNVPEFSLPLPPRTRGAAAAVIGSQFKVDPFDQYGGRTVTLRSRGKDTPIVQKITRIRPDYVEVKGVNIEWDQALDTRLIPSKELTSMLHLASKADKLDDRKAIIQFFLDARRFKEAKEELELLLKEHPELKEWGEPQIPLIDEQNYRTAINGVLPRQKAGQHGLASLIARKAPPDKVSADTYRLCQELAAQYQQAVEQSDEARLLLEQLESELTEEEAAALRPLRRAVAKEMHYESLPRLEPFLRSKPDNTLKPQQKLALAYSAWVVGPSFADVDLLVARNLWQARFLVLEFLRADGDPVKRESLVEQIKALEGVTVERLAQMIPLLPYTFEDMPPAPGEARRYAVQLDDGIELQYAVTLPAEYHPAHRYPLIVALRRSGMTLEQTLQWWAGDQQSPGTAMARGYIVISPEFAEKEADEYDYDAAAHHRVLAAIDDCRRKFAVDSDRVFLCGHQLGADAAYDIALSHPDRFAGVAPFVGQVDRYATRLTRNGADLPWYIVAGERDRDTIGKNTAFVTSLVRDKKADITYCEYKGRGFESYFEELPRLFDWMDSQQRKSLRDMRTGWDVDILRRSDDRFYWVLAKDLPPKLAQPIAWSNPASIPRTMSIDSKVLPGNVMYVNLPSGRTRSNVRVWLSPEFVDFDRKLQIIVNHGQPALNAPPQPDVSAMLEDLRERGDRQRLFWAVLDL